MEDFVSLSPVRKNIVKCGGAVDKETLDIRNGW